MKYLIYFLLPFLFTLASCKDDDNCVPGDLETVIVGQWDVDGTSEEVEFRADGTFIDNNETLVFNPDGDDMEYFVDSESLIRIRVNISTPADYLVPVSNFTCNEIDLSVAGFDFTLNRQ